jgi:hypothetical protein
MTDEQRYPNERPRTYTVHVIIEAAHDEQAVKRGTLVLERLTASGLRFVAPDEPAFVTDTDDWAEHVTTDCRWATLGRYAADAWDHEHEGPLTRTGCGRRLCERHAAIYTGSQRGSTA